MAGFTYKDFLLYFPRMLKLKAEKRDIFGKDLAEVRKGGKMPAVLYGPKESNMSLLVETKEFAKILKEAGESTVVTIETPDGNKDVLIYSVDFQPVSGEPIHADLYAVDKTKKVTVSVPIEFEGIAPAIKELGGILVKVMHEIEVEALPQDLPHDIVVDVSGLTTLESQVLIKDLVPPKGVEFLAEAEEVVASIDVAKEEVEESAEAPDLSAIEVEKKGKQDEETPTE